MGEASNSSGAHLAGMCDQSGQVRDGSHRAARSVPVTSDDHVMLPFEFLLKKKLEWSWDDVEDGGEHTMSFRRSWVPAVLACVLIYFALFVQTSSATDSLVAKRYIAIFVMVFLVSAVPFAPDGPFKWPHPVFWKLLFCLSVLYQLGLTLLLFQTADQSRQSLKYLDESLGEPLSRKSYGENCTFWDPEHPERVLNKLWAECDIYWASHTLGFYFNALALRDYWLAHVLSVMFELVEYSLEHHIPEFQECWWDHWILDVVLCNSLGIWCGMKTLEYLNMRLYNWRGLWDVPAYPGKRKQKIEGHNWTQVDWSLTRRFKRCLCVFAFIASLLIMELNAFYLKSVLWIPISHWLQTVRLVLYLVGGAVVSRRVYRYMDDPNCENLGYETWMACLLVITEIVIIVRFGPDLLQIPLPDHVMRCWIVGFVCLMSWAVWRFFIR